MKKYLLLSMLIVANYFSFSQNSQNSTGFIENKGQIGEKNGKLHPEVGYKLQEANVNAYFKADGIIYHFHKSEEKKKGEYTKADRENYQKGDFNAVGRKIYFFRMDFSLIGADKNATHTATNEQEEKFNYYLAHCPAGILDVKSFGEILYKNVYPNIDVKYYLKEGKLKYEFIVQPGGNIEQIKFLYDGAKKVSIENKKLRVENTYNTLLEEEPYTYYLESGSEIKSSFKLTDNVVSFGVEHYDASKTIVIDPTVTWASYYSNGTSSDFHANSAFDSNGNIFTAFATYYNTWPTINAGSGQYYDGTLDGSLDLVIAKINANYSKQWTTFYGGDGSEVLCGTGGDYGKTLGIDASDNVYVAGSSSSGTIFPTMTSGASGAFYQDQTKLYGGDTPFLVKLNNNGVRQWATLFQHEQANTNSAGMRINGILVKGTKLYFTGETYKFNNNNIPLRTLAGAYNNSTFLGDQDPFIGRFSDNCILEWSTYLNSGIAGQKAYKQGSDLTMDPSGNLIYAGQVTGGSGYSATSAYLLNPGGGAYYRGTFVGSADVQITKFNTSMQPVWSTYYGSTELDRISEVSTDASGNILMACRTIGGPGLATANPGGAFYYATKQTPGTWTSGSSSDGGIAKFTAGTNALYWATYVGGTNADWANINGITSDNAGNIYVIGYTNTTNFPTQNLAGSYNQATTGGGMDMVAMKFGPTGSLTWSTYYGGSATDYCYGVKINPSSLSNGCGYKQFNAFGTSSTNLPTTNPGAPAFYESTIATTNSNGVLLIADPNSSGNSTASTGITASAAAICAGGTTTLTVSGGSLGSGASWQWYTGSCGGTSAGSGASISVSPGSATTYYVRAEGTCNTTTCSNVAINVNAPSVAPTGINAVASTLCSGGSTTLTVSGGSLGTSASWQWYSGSCGGTAVGSGASIVVTPGSTTTYYVRAQGTCNNTSCASTVINVNSNSAAPTSISPSASTICSGGNTTLSVSGGSLGSGASWQWFTGSCGGTSAGTGSSISVSPGAATTYYVYASGTCNTTSCASTVINVNSNSTAPTSINTTTNTICPGGNTTLSVNGGSLGSGASWQWFTGSCGGTAAGTGNSISVSPGSTTTYYVYATGTCNTTSCANVVVNVNSSSSAATSINTTTSTICPGGNTTLSVNGGALGTAANWQWYSGSCGGTAVGSGISVVVSPGAATTYYVRAEGACNNTGCVSTVINMNTTSSAPASITTTTTTICPGNNTTLSVNGGSLGSGANWQWFTGSCNGSAAGSGSSITVSPGSATTYFVNAIGSCNTTACANVAINVSSNSTAATSINTTTNTVCSGGNTTLSVSGGALGTAANWQWYSGSCVGTLVGSGSSITVSPTSATTYYVRAEGACGNTGCVSVVINVNANSVAPTSITTSSTTVCSGSNNTLSVNGGSLGSGANWQWFTGSCTGTSAGSGSSITVSPTSQTTYYVKAVGTCNSTTCSSVTINVNSVSTAPSSINASSAAICSGTSSTLTVSGGGLGTGASWNWYANGCGTTLVGTGPTLTVSPSITTAYFVRAEGSCGNSLCAQLTVSVTTTPSATWLSPGTICTGSGVLNLSSLVTGNTGGTWSGTGVTGTSFDPGALAGQTIPVTYSVANGLCTNAVTHSISVASSVSANWNSPGGLCASGGTVNLSTYVTGSTGGTWTGSGISGTTLDPLALSGPVAITYSVGSGSCSDSKTYTINITPAASAVWTSPGTLCASNGTVNLNTYLSGTAGGTWTGTGITGSIFDPSALAGQIVLVNYQVGNVPCVASVSHTIQVVNVGNATFNLPSTICENAANLNLAALVTGNAGGVFTGTGVTTNTFSPAGLVGQSIVITYTVGAAPCGAAQSKTITVTSAPSSPSVAVSNATICAGLSTTVSATGSGGGGAVYTVYSSPNGVGAIGTTPVALSPSVTTTYYLQSFSGGCSNMGGDVPFTVNVNATPVVNAGADENVCLGSSVTLTASGGGTYVWSNGVTTSTNVVSPSVNTSYTVVVTNANLCVAQDVVNVSVVTAGSLQASNDHAATQSNQSVTANVASNDTGNPNTVSIVSGPQHGSATVGSNGTIVYTPNDNYVGADTVYYSICDASCGLICKTAKLVIDVTKEIVIVVPGGFSPNGDGLNDKFEIVGLENFPDNELVIFNRWGDEVFKAAPYKNDWNGQSEGKGLTLYGSQLVEGTYFYILLLDKTSKPYKGYIELKRK